MQKVAITKERTVHTYAELWQGSAFCLTSGQLDAQGARWHFLSSLLLTAFSFEAYLNHVGPESTANWEDLERLAPLAKLRVLAELLEVQLPASGERPFQTVRKLLQFRNTVAHGRSSELTYSPVLRTVQNYQSELMEPPLADWEQLAETDEFAIQARSDVEATLRLIQTGRKGSPENLFTTGAGQGSATLV